MIWITVYLTFFLFSLKIDLPTYKFIIGHIYLCVYILKICMHFFSSILYLICSKSLIVIRGFSEAVIKVMLLGSLIYNNVCLSVWMRKNSERLHWFEHCSILPCCEFSCIFINWFTWTGYTKPTAYKHDTHAKVLKLQ